MPPRRRYLITLLEFADLVVVCASMVFAVAMTAAHKTGDPWLAVLRIRLSLANLLFVAFYLLVWHLALRTRGLYNSYRLSPATRELKDLAGVVAATVVPLVPIAYFLKPEALAPALPLFAITTFCALGAERRLLRAAARRVRSMGRNLRDVVLIGAGKASLEVAASLARRDSLGYSVAAVIDAEGESAMRGNDWDPAPILERLGAILARQPIDEVFIALPLDRSQVLMRTLISTCEEQGIIVRVLANLALLEWAWAAVDTLNGQPVVTIASGPREVPSFAVKRLFDVVVSAIALLLLSPLFALVAIAIRLDSPGPVLFRQRRVGLHRREFEALKFRTMVSGADRMQNELESLNEAEGPIFKITNDPRVTRVGRFLRRTSMDELPQLWNVMRGDMSLVGPRPLPVRDVDRIDVRWHHRRFSVKPGITCLWQVESRAPRFDEWIRADMEYIDNWSFGLDLKILAKTIPAVLSGQGAH